MCLEENKKKKIGIWLKLLFVYVNKKGEFVFSYRSFNIRNNIKTYKNIRLYINIKNIKI
jgi:hypothetical protein